MSVFIDTASLLLRSPTRSDSCFPPPLVSRIKGIRWDWRYESALWARGRGSELRTRTPSMLYNVNFCLYMGRACLSYSKANANSGISDGGADAVWRERYWGIRYVLQEENAPYCRSNDRGLKKAPGSLLHDSEAAIARYNRGIARASVVRKWRRLSGSDSWYGALYFPVLHANAHLRHLPFLPHSILRPFQIAFHTPLTADRVAQSL